MSDPQKWLSVIYAAIDEQSDLDSGDAAPEKSEATILMGPGG